MCLMDRMIGFVKNWAPRVGGLGNATTREQAEAEILKSFKESAHAYFEAADKFPEDDEAHVCRSPLSPFLYTRFFALLFVITSTGTNSYSRRQGTSTVVLTFTGVPASPLKSPFPSWNAFAKLTTRCARQRYGRTRRWLCKGGIKRFRSWHGSKRM